MTQIFGVDFSGSQIAGRKIWMTSAQIKDDQLVVEDVRRAVDFTDSGRLRDTALLALRQFIASQKDAVFGLDFAFGLPQSLVSHSTWIDFVKAFGEDYPNETIFYSSCRTKSEGREFKRLTDIDARTPFSPYNLRMYRQTYYGIRDVLSPLVREDAARILPMQTPQDGKPIVLEICPASTLRVLGRYVAYKGKQTTHRDMRYYIATYLEKDYSVSIPKAHFETLIQDTEGDALDSLIAAFTAADYVFDTLKAKPNHPLHQLEGFVYITEIP
jgi:hypothetical protein